MITLNIPGFFPIVIPGKQGDGRNTERWHALINLSWVLRAWASTVCESYVTQSPRYNEVAERWEEIGRHIRPHLTEDEWHEFRHAVLDEDTGLFRHDNYQKKRR
jgi:hypothetical protein